MPEVSGMQIERGELGSKPGKQLLEELRPNYWFAAHYHIKFPALVRHPPSEALDNERATELSEQFTRFLSLDKCLPGRRFLQASPSCWCLQLPESLKPLMA